MESPERIWQLIAKALNSEASSEEKEELFYLLQDNPSLRQQYELLNRIWNEKHDHPGDEEDAKLHISRIINKARYEITLEEFPNHRKRRRHIIAFTSIIAAAMIVAGWFLFAAPDEPAPN